MNAKVHHLYNMGMKLEDILDCISSSRQPTRILPYDAKHAFANAWIMMLKAVSEVMRQNLTRIGLPNEFRNRDGNFYSQSDNHYRVKI
jgi:hypothetical protein